MNAADLTSGTWLQTSAGTWVQIVAIQAWIQTAAVHNLTIQEIHTYYVLIGGTQLLAHNANGVCPVKNVLSNWNNQRFQFGNQQFLLDRSNMKHILERHHPDFWDGSVKEGQSFFDRGMSVQDIQGAIGGVLRQNRGALVNQGSGGMYQIQGKVDGVNYVLGINRGHIGQFFPGSLR